MFIYIYIYICIYFLSYFKSSTSGLLGFFAKGCKMISQEISNLDLFLS